MKTNGQQSDKVEEFQFHTVPKTTAWQNFQNTIYNSTTQQFLGRTRKSWGQILLFYTIFYACLAVFFAICAKGLFSTLDDKAPKWKLNEGLIGTNPGLGFRPISEETSEGSLIWYIVGNSSSAAKWVNSMDKFLQHYRIEQTDNNFQECDYGTTLEEGNVCKFDLKKFGPCSPENKYGYNTTSPCVFLKLNRIFDWVPDYYTDATAEMPKDLKNAMTNSSNRGVWISCEGERSLDKENVERLEYYPERIFPQYYFPYTNNDNYLSPLIAVRLVNIKNYVVVNIECRAWARNIKYHGGNLDRAGSVHFELLIDS